MQFGIEAGNIPIKDKLSKAKEESTSTKSRAKRKKVYGEEPVALSEEKPNKMADKAEAGSTMPTSTIKSRDGKKLQEDIITQVWRHGSRA